MCIASRMISLHNLGPPRVPKLRQSECISRDDHNSVEVIYHVECRARSSAVLQLILDKHCGRAPITSLVSRRTGYINSICILTSDLVMNLYGRRATYNSDTCSQMSVRDRPRGSHYLMSNSVSTSTLPTRTAPSSHFVNPSTA